MKKFIKTEREDFIIIIGILHGLFKVLLEYMVLNERGVNCLRGIFANFEGIMKINAELQRKESRKQIPKTVLRCYYKNNRLFCRNNRLFLSAVNNFKKIYVRLGKERITQTDLYWFSLTPKTTSSPQKPLGNPLCNQNQITHITHQSSDLEPLKKHYLWQTTPRMLILNTSRTHNTPWQHNYRNTVIKEEGNRIRLGITNLKFQNYNPILFHTLKVFRKTIDCFVETIGWIDLTTKSSFSKPFSKTTKVKQPVEISTAF